MKIVADKFSVFDEPVNLPIAADVVQFNQRLIVLLKPQAILNFFVGRVVIVTLLSIFYIDKSMYYLSLLLPAHQICILLRAAYNQHG